MPKPSRIEVQSRGSKERGDLSAAVFEKLPEAERIPLLLSMLDRLESSVHKDFNSQVQKVVDEAKAKKESLNTPAIRKKLEEIDRGVILPFAKQKSAQIALLLKLYGKLPKAAKAQVGAGVKHALKGTESMFLTKLVKGTKGRVKMAALMASMMFATDKLSSSQKETDKEIADIFGKGAGAEMGQLLLDVLPVAGTVSNYYSALSGKEAVTGKNVGSLKDRASNVAWGTVSFAGDIVTVLALLPSGGSSVAANIILRLTALAANGSKIAIRLLKLMPRIEKLAKEVGGWSALAARVRTEIKEGKTVTAKTLQAAEKGMTKAGLTLIAGGAAYYGFIDEKTEFEVPEELLG